MAWFFNRWFGGGDVAADFERLRRLREIAGVTDIFLVDAQGTMLWKASSLNYEDRVAREAAHALRAATMAIAEEVRRTEQGADCTYAVYRSGMAAGWEFGQAFLLVLCSEAVDLSRLRMAVNVFRDSVVKNRRLRRYFVREPTQAAGAGQR